MSNSSVNTSQIKSVVVAFLAFTSIGAGSALAHTDFPDRLDTRGATASYNQLVTTPVLAPAAGLSDAENSIITHQKFGR